MPGTACRDAPPRPCLRGEAIGVLRDAAQKGHLIQPVGEGNPEGFLEEAVDTMAKSPRITGRWAGREGEAPGAASTESGREGSLGTENHRLFRTCSAVGRVPLVAYQARRGQQAPGWALGAADVPSPLQVGQPRCGETEHRPGSESRGVGWLRSVWSPPPTA